MMAIARAAAWVALIVVGLLGEEMSSSAAFASIALAGPVALVTFVATVVAIWRGPPLVEFEPEEGLRCGEQDSEPVRAYAQLRGLIGGAGHVHPARLALPAISWAAALVAGVRGVSPALAAAGPSPVLLAVAAALGARLFPSRPYWYREVMGGGAVVSPPEAVAELTARELSEDAPGIAAVHEAGRAVPILRARGSRAGSGAPSDGQGTFARRSPRYTLRRTLVVEQAGRELEVAALNVSAGGLAVHWPGDPPVVGDSILVKLGSGVARRGVDAVVRWRRPGAGRDRAVGLELRAHEGAHAAWRELVDLAASAVVDA